MTGYAPKVTGLRGDELQATPEQRAQAVWLVQKYSSLTYIRRMLELYSRFLEGYERKSLPTLTASEYRETLQTMFAYQGLLQQGIQEILDGYKGGYDRVWRGSLFGDYIFSRRFENGADWEPFGYRRKKPATGLFAWADRASNMADKVSLTLRARWAFPKMFEPFFGPFAGPPPAVQAFLSAKITARTGREVSSSGIWLADDARIQFPNYLIGGMRAPPAQRLSARVDIPAFPGGDGTPAAPAEVDYEYQDEPTTWRLLWLDQRYADGKIPEDEAVYLDPSTEPPPWPARAPGDEAD